MGVSDRLKSGQTSQNNSSGGVSSRIKQENSYYNARGAAEMDESRLVNESRQPVIEEVKTPLADRIQNPNVLDKIFKDNPIARVINYPFAKAAEYSIPDAPLIGNRSDGTYGNLPGTNARSQFIQENPIASTGNATADKVGNFIGEIGSFLTPMGSKGTGVQNAASDIVKRLSGTNLGMKAEEALGRVGANAVSKINPFLVRQGIQLNPNAGAKAAQAVGRGAIDFGIANPLHTLQTTDPSAGELAKSTVTGVIGGAALGGGASALGSLGKSALGQFAQKYAGTKVGDAIGRFMDRSSSRGITDNSSQPNPELSNKFAPTKLTPLSGTETLDRVMSRISPVVTERMTPPLENPNELAKWIRGHLGNEISLNEVRTLPYEDLRQLAEEIRKGINLHDTAINVAKEHGYNLRELLEGRAPSLAKKVEQQAQERVYGVYPTELPRVRKPDVIPAESASPGANLGELSTKAEGFNPQRTVSSAQAMKGNWFTNLFGNQGVGISAFGSRKKVGTGPVSTMDQLVNKGIKNDVSGIGEEIAAKARELYQNHVDQLSPLRNINDRTYETAMDATRGNNIANTIVKDKFVTPEGIVVGGGLSDIFKKVARGQDKQFIDYLTLRHAKTRLERGERVYAEQLNMTPEAVQKRIEMYEKRHPEFADIAKDWDNFNDNVLKYYGVNEGLISPELYQSLREKNPNYSPMRRQFSKSEKPGRKFLEKSTGSAYSGQKAPLQRVSPTGSVRDIVDPRRTTIETIGSWANAALRNRVMQSMVEAIKRDPQKFKGIAEIVQQPKGKADLRRVLLDGGEDEFIEALNNDFKDLFKTTKVNKDNIVRAMVNGQPVYIQVYNPEIVKTLMGMGPQASNILIDTFSALSNATKRGATGALAPVFAIKGTTMDLLQSAIQAKNPAQQAAYTVYGLLSGIGDKLNIPGLRNLAQEYRRAGGEFSAALKGDRKVDQSISSMTRDPLLSPKGVAKTVKGAVMAPFRALESIGDIAENAPRIAAYRNKLQELGGERTPDNVRQAMSAAREITTNFSRKGAKSRDIEAFIPYQNAAVQGTNRILRGFKNNPVRTAAAVGTLAVLPKLYEYFQFADDPDYQNLPARERMRFLIVHKNDDGTFTKIPMEPAYNSFGELTVEALRKFKDNDPQAFKDTADALANAWLPPSVTGALQGATQGTGVQGSIEGALNATVGAPAIAIAANKSFTGAPIENMGVQDRSPQYRYDERTSSVAKKIGEITGFSPMKTDYLIRAYGGDPARLVLPLLSEVGGGSPRNTLLKNFIVDPKMTNNLTNDFYGSKEKLSQAYRDNQELGIPLPEWYDDNLRKAVTSTAKSSISSRVKDLNDLKKQVTANSALSAEAKTKRIRDLQSQINEIYADINSKMYEKRIPTK